MPSIVLELQQDSLNRNLSVSDLLRKALLIATKLDVPEFKTWIEGELRGYRGVPGDLPAYRMGAGTVMAKDRWNRWLPVRFDNPKLAELASRVAHSDSVAEIEALIDTTKRNSGTVTLDFSPEHEQMLRSWMQNPEVLLTRFVRGEDLKGILDAVRTEILQWALRLEKAGILGENLSFSAEEKRKAKAAAVNITSHFYGPVANVAQNAEHFSQTASIEANDNDLRQLVQQLSDHLGDLNLDARQLQRAEAQLSLLKTELADEPDPAVVSQAVRSLRSITEGAIGSLLATAAINPGVWQWIMRVFAGF